MNYFADFLLILFSSVIVFISYKEMVFNKNSSVGHFVILAIYVFCCLPIILNYLIGIPRYLALYWYQVFIPSMSNASVSGIYDIYMLISIAVLFYYSNRRDKNCTAIHIKEPASHAFSNKAFHLLIILSPVVYVLISGNFSKFLSYTSLAARGVSSQDGIILNMLILLSIFCLCIFVFPGKITKGKVLFLVVMSFLLAWLQGKRFVLAIMGVMYLFFLTKAEISDRARRRLFWVAPIGVTLLICFSGIYFLYIKPLSNMSLETYYDMFRVDFGRDDVIKYVIFQELFQDNQILDYPGQSFLSTFLTFIPRFVWSTKPFCHYEYLTASILSIPITQVVSGTTPCWYEMCLCNFGYIGFFVGILGLPFFCWIADSMKQTKSRALVFIMIIVLLTQSTDVYFVYIFLIIVYCIDERILCTRNVLAHQRRRQGMVYRG